MNPQLEMAVLRERIADMALRAERRRQARIIRRIPPLYEWPFRRRAARMPSSGPSGVPER